MPKIYGDLEYQSSTRAVLSGTGTASLPGITFSGDLNTGIYRPAADQLGFSTGGSLRLTINDEGALVISDITAPVTTTNKLYAVGGLLYWDGNQLGADGSAGTIANYIYTVSSSQSSFSGADDNSNVLSYTVGKIQVFLNGVLLEDTTDYTATTGTSVVLGSPATTSDVLQVLSFGTFVSSNYAELNSNNTFLQRQDFDSGGDSIRLTGGTADHGYITFYTDNDNPTVRQAYVGIGGAATPNFTIKNEATDGHLDISTTGTGLIRANGSQVATIGNNNNFTVNQTIDIATVGDWNSTGTYAGLWHKDMASTEYAILSSTTNTYISCGTGGLIFIRPENNDTTYQMRLSKEGAFNYVDRPFAPTPNLIPRGGIMCTGDSGWGLLGTTSTTFNTDSFMAIYNGGTLSDGGKYVYNSTTYGGTNAAINASVQALLSTMGRSGGAAQYGKEFHIAEAVAGSGTLSGYSSHYLMLTNSQSALFGPGGVSTFSFWARATAGTPIIRYGNVDLLINRVLQSSDYNLTSTWVHVCLRFQNVTQGYNNIMWFVYGTNGDTVQLALPVLQQGLIAPYMHVYPCAGAQY